MFALKRNTLSGSQAGLTSASRSNVPPWLGTSLDVALLEQAREVQVGAAADGGDDVAAPRPRFAASSAADSQFDSGLIEPRRGALPERAVVVRDAGDRAAVGPDVDRGMVGRPAPERLDEVVDEAVGKVVCERRLPVVAHRVGRVFGVEELLELDVWASGRRCRSPPRCRGPRSAAGARRPPRAAPPPSRG